MNLIQNLSNFPTKKLTCESDIQLWLQWPKCRRGVKLTPPPARFWTFFSLPGIGLRQSKELVVTNMVTPFISQQLQPSCAQAWWQRGTWFSLASRWREPYRALEALTERLQSEVQIVLRTETKYSFSSNSKFVSIPQNQGPF